jgi:hypothetical protein
MKKKSYKKKEWRSLGKKKKRGKNLSPRNKKACHSGSTALLYQYQYCPYRRIAAIRKTVK